MSIDLDDPFVDADYVARREIEGATEEPRFIVPISCWRPKYGTGIAADAEMYPAGCPDPIYCRGTACFWRCTDNGWDA